MAWVRERAMPAEWPLFVGEVSANFNMVPYGRLNIDQMQFLFSIWLTKLMSLSGKRLQRKENSYFISLFVLLNIFFRELL
jgi:hypothetical protein